MTRRVSEETPLFLADTSGYDAQHLMIKAGVLNARLYGNCQGPKAAQLVRDQRLHNQRRQNRTDRRAALQKAVAEEAIRRCQRPLRRDQRAESRKPSYPARARTWNEGAKIPSVTITLPGNPMRCLILRIFARSTSALWQKDRTPSRLRPGGSLLDQFPRPLDVPPLRMGLADR